LIHYLSGAASGVAGFEDMGKDWVPVRTAAHDGTLRSGDPRARHVAERWDQFTEYLCLSLSQELGRNVVSVRPRKQTTSTRLDELEKALATEGYLRATVRVPDAIGDLQIRADLKSRQTSFSVDVTAPSEGRPKSRINWLLRQLGDAWSDLRVEVWYPHARETVAVTLEQARERPEILLFPADTTREPRSFVLTLSRPMGQKRSRVEGSFVRETREQAVTFYRDLVQNLKAWQVRPPKIRAEPTVADSSDPPSPPDFLLLTHADRMLPAPANGNALDGDAADGVAPSPPPARPLQGSIQGSVVSKSDPTEPEATPANTGNLTQPDPPSEIL
jgi:hypothetical protein